MDWTPAFPVTARKHRGRGARDRKRAMPPRVGAPGAPAPAGRMSVREIAAIVGPSRSPLCSTPTRGAATAQTRNSHGHP